MIQRCGVIFIENTEITIRIYEIDQTEWRLLQYQNTQLQQEKNQMTEIVEILADFLAEDGSAVSEWKIAARGIPSSTIQHISSAIGMSIEIITPLREQEIISKGLFTELW
jgi:hypothetical protein